MSFSETVMSWFFGDESGIDHEATDRSAQRIAAKIAREAQQEGKSITEARRAFTDWYRDVVWGGKVTREQFPVASEIADKVDDILRKGQRK